MSKIKEAAAEPAETVTLSLNPRQIQVRDCRDPTIRVFSRFFDPVGHENMYASEGQLISIGLFYVMAWTKKPTKVVKDFCLSL